MIERDINAIGPGALLCRAVVAPDGNVLYAAGTMLTPAILALIKGYGMRTLGIEFPQRTAPAPLLTDLPPPLDQDAVLLERFRYADRDHPAIQILMRLAQGRGYLDHPPGCTDDA